MSNILPYLQFSNMDYTRQNATDTQREDCEDVIISIVRAALVDDEANVRSAAAQAFDVLQEELGSKAIDQTIPTLLEALRQPGKGSGTALQALTEVMNVRFQSFFIEMRCVLNRRLGPSFHCFPCFDSDIDGNSDDGLQCSCTCVARDGRWKCVKPTTDCHFEFISEGIGR